MKTPLLLVALASLTLTSLAAADMPPAPSTPVYELRIYQPNPGKSAALLTRFREHTLEIFTRLGMKNVAYWTTMDAEPGAENKLVYLLFHESREAAKKSWTLFRDDPEWKRVREASEVDGKLTANVQSTFLTATDFSAAMTTGAGVAGRVFEFRTYHTLPGRLTALDARFRDHTRRIFTKVGMTNLGYFHPQDADKGAGDTLIYFLAHASREAAKASWAAFQADPEWIAARDASQADGPILQPKGVTSVFLTPVDFSPLR